MHGNMALSLGIVMLTMLFSHATAQRYHVISPNVFRLNVEETVSVQVDTRMNLELYIQDPLRTKVISKIARVFQAGSPEIVKMKITEADLPKSWAGNKLYFSLVAKGNGFQKELPVLLHLRSGTVLIQTDKPIYSPKDLLVKYRVIPVGIDLLPMKEKVMIEIKNPLGIRVRRERDIEAFKKGFASKEYRFGELAALGTWTIIAYFGYQNQMNSTTTFVLKNYVLPTFQVKIGTAPYVTNSMKEIPVKVTAKYSFGKKVSGYIRLQISVINDIGQAIRIYNQETIIKGDTVFGFPVKKITEAKEIASFPFGQHLKIVAEVTEAATGTKEMAKLESLPIVKSPFTISFEKTVKYFKPSVSFMVWVLLRYPNKSPVKGEKLEFEAKDGNNILSLGKDSTNQATTNGLGEASFIINIPDTANDATRIKIKVRTKNTEVENAVAEMTLEPYRSAQRNYILIRIPFTRPRIGDRTLIRFLIPNDDGINQLSYLVVSRGKIIVSKVLNNQIGTETSFMLTITADMAPKCRILAFFVRNGEMASDSVLMDIEDDYKNKVLLNTNPDPSSMDFRPGKELDVRVKTTSKSFVGLLAVDQSVYFLRNESRITNEKVFEDIGVFDLGCGLGSGKDNKDVFENAGLSMITNIPFSVTKRADLTCPGNNNQRRGRKRRSLKSKMPVLIERCCKGRCCNRLYEKEIFVSKCEEMKPLIDPLCWADFYSCCMSNFQSRGRTLNVQEWIPKPDEIDESEGDLTLRQSFVESWMWTELHTQDDGLLTVGFTLPDSITTWKISALAINDETGFGLSKTIDIQSKLDIFVHIKMPYSVQRREQVAIQAVVYNFNAQRSRVNLFMRGHSSFCSIAKPDEKSERISFIINGNEAIAIPFTIIPLQVGKIPIEFLVFSFSGGDRIIKDLLVLPEGDKKTKTYSFVLDPQGLMDDKSKGGKKSNVQRGKNSQINSIDLKMPEETIPNSHTAVVYVTGNLMSAGVTDIIENGLQKLVRLPTGCGEQTMIGMAPLVYVLRYLYSIENGVTQKIEKTAYDYMRKGYTNELKWRRNDNSYSVWGQKTAASTWLSAFVNKVFCEASTYIKDDIDNAVICDTSKFLESVQLADGSFKEGYNVHHREMIGGVSNSLALTAYVVISLLECKPQCSNADASVIVKASKYLESKVAATSSGYALSLMAYALALANSPGKYSAYNKLVGLLKEEIKNGRTLRHIQEGGIALQVESTAYTILTMMKYKKVEEAGPLVVWLTERRNARGSFVSTQDTVIALQALSEYGAKTSGGDLDLKVTVSSAENKDIRKTFEVKKENALLRMEADITNAVPGRINIDTNGQGTAQLQIELTYNVPDSDEECEYKIEIRTIEENANVISDGAISKPKAVKKKKKKNKRKCCKRKGKRRGKGKRKCRKCKGKKEKKDKKNKENKKQSDQAPDTLKIEVCASHKFANASGMTIVEVGLLTGFKAIENSLKELLKNRDPKINHYEVSDRNVVFYLEKITGLRSCVVFTMERYLKVGALQAVPVKVYDYYEPGSKCTKFYRPKKGSELVKQICEDSECACSQGGCAKVRTSNDKTLIRHACKANQNVFIGQIRGIEDKNSLQKIIFRVESIYKKGQKQFEVGSKLNAFKATACEDPVLENDKRYLVILKDSPVHILNDEAYILPWPEPGRIQDKLLQALTKVKEGTECDKLSV